ncbi:MAG: 4Fe-4S binding protein, partial [Thermoanaerobacterales bacterium]|nr:4Fe-4S binding protein [Thermoanaerobacterales bacterium]
MISLKVDVSKCNKCGICQFVCSLGHKLWEQKDISFEGDLPKPRVWFGQGEHDELFICRHCENPVCVTGCVAGAMSIDKETGRVVIDDNKCVGCGSCVMECPFGAVWMLLRNSESIHYKAFKCDGCQKIGIPLCARFCPNGAITAEETDKKLTKLRRRQRIIMMKGEHHEKIRNYR